MSGGKTSCGGVGWVADADIMHTTRIHEEITYLNRTHSNGNITCVLCSVLQCTPRNAFSSIVRIVVIARVHCEKMLIRSLGGRSGAHDPSAANEERWTGWGRGRCAGRALRKVVQVHRHTHTHSRLERERVLELDLCERAKRVC